MSTPMYDTPEHHPIGVTEDGQGPAADYEVHHYVCWCGNPECVWTKAFVADNTALRARVAELEAKLAAVAELADAWRGGAWWNKAAARTIDAILLARADEPEDERRTRDTEPANPRQPDAEAADGCERCGRAEEGRRVVRYEAGGWVQRFLCGGLIIDEAEALDAEAAHNKPTVCGDRGKCELPAGHGGNHCAAGPGLSDREWPQAEAAHNKCPFDCEKPGYAWNAACPVHGREAAHNEEDNGCLACRTGGAAGRAMSHTHARGEPR